MNERQKYDPEDLESLLRSKDFGDLYPEEHEFVMKHIDGEDEYRSMRELLQVLEEQPADAVPPHESLKKDVLAGYRSERRYPAFSLNQWLAMLWPQDVSLWRRPAFALALVCLIGGGVLFWQPRDSNQSDLLAEQVQPAEEQDEKEPQERQPVDEPSDESEPETTNATQAEEAESEAPAPQEQVLEEPRESLLAEKRQADSPVADEVADEFIAELDAVETDEETDQSAAGSYPAASSANSITYSETTSVPLQEEVRVFQDEAFSSEPQSAKVVSARASETEATRLDTQPLLKKKEQKQLMELLYSCY